MELAGEYRRNRRQRSPSDTCSTTNPHNILGLNPGPCNEMSAINRLNKPQHEKENLKSRCTLPD